MDDIGLTTLKVSRDGPVARVILSRPEKRNALNPRMHEELGALLPRLNEDPMVRVIVFTGAGESFCSGADIKEFYRDLENEPVLRARIMDVARRWLWESLAQSPKATVAMVNGHCFGGGLLLTMACDIVVASDRAVFGLPEINWGHIPGGAASLKSIELMGLRTALYYAMTGENFSAETALRGKLVTRVTSHERLEAEVASLASMLADKSPAALQAIKELYRAAQRLDVDGVHEYVTAKLDQLRVRDEGGLREKGMADFVAKRLRTTGNGAAAPAP